MEPPPSGVHLGALRTFVLLLVLIVAGMIDGADIKATPDPAACGYKNCPAIQPGKTNVHLICHTHDDVGWVKTADEYYYGGRREENIFSVEQILDSVIPELMKSKDRRFVYVESAFLWRWWQSKPENVRADLKKLVEEGRMQLLGGGWVMSDEATPHYSAMIDQMTLGLRFMKDTFGECNLPKVAWQIDPFGHSSEVAMEFAQMGYDGLFFSRIHVNEYHERSRTKTLEMIWRPDTREGADSELFAGQMFNFNSPYHPPEMLCFDQTCNNIGSDPVVDDPTSHAYNVKRRAKEFEDAIRQWQAPYNTTNVMMTMGGDFHYMVASSWYNNLDRLIKYTNANSKEFNVFYSTPACYLKAVHAETEAKKQSWPVKDNADFFPYVGSSSEFWTGYYTSRPCFKSYVYKANNILQASKQMRVALGDSRFAEEEARMKRAVATVQHHDAVSGTEKSFVADDYASTLSAGIAGCEKIVSALLSEWQGDWYPKELDLCHKLNVTECATSEANPRLFVSVYNLHAHPKNWTVILPVKLGEYLVTDAEGNHLDNEIVPVPEELKHIPGRHSTENNSHQLVFEAAKLPPLGVNVFHVEMKRELSSFGHSLIKIPAAAEGVTIENGVLTLKFGPDGLLSKVIRGKGEEWNVDQNFFRYSSGEFSGAYLFNPFSEAQPVNPTSTLTQVKFTYFKGRKVSEVHQKFSDYLSQTIRLHKGRDEIEFIWTVGSLPENSNIVTRYKVQNITTDSQFYTDSNGRRLMKREHRSSNIGENFYPITSAAVLKDANHRMTVLTDRPQGAASLLYNTIEIMLHRRASQDDNKGLNEALNEQAYGKGSVTRGVHVVQLSTGKTKPVPADHPFDDGAARHRVRAQELVLQPILAVAKTELDSTKWKEVSKPKGKGVLVNPLPENVHLLTLERWTEGSLLVRLEHIYEPKEHSQLSTNVNIKLQDLFADFTVTKAVELSLSATFKKSEMNRFMWIRNGTLQAPPEHSDSADPLQVTLKPMEIKTIEVFVTRRSGASSGMMVSGLSLSTVVLLVLTILASVFLI